VRRELRKERGNIDDAVAILGLSRRFVQERAASGLLPGAAKFGRRWTFDLGKLREHVKEREAETCERAKSLKRHVAASGVATRCGDVSVSLVQNRSAGHLRQMIQKSRERVTLLEKQSTSRR
jgi:hypothetical protein